MAGWAARDSSGHDTGKQAATIGTGAAMQRIGQMILLMRGTPQRHAPAHFAQMNWLFTRTLGHRAPAIVAHPAEIVANIADHHADIRTLVLKAHSVHLCITVLAAQHPCVMCIPRLIVACVSK